MIKRKRHPEQEIEAAIQWAEQRGWRYETSGQSAHVWGRLLCPIQERETESLSIWLTPKDAHMHAEQIRHHIVNSMTTEVNKE
jgi:hypothetical protein